MRQYRAVLAAIALSALACGTGKATIKSNKRTGYDRQIAKTLVYFTFPRMDLGFMDAFKYTLQKELRQRGAEVRFGDVVGDLTADTAPSLLKQGEDFSAGHALLFLPNGGTVNQYDTVLLARFDVQLHDIKLGEIVWRADLEYTPGSREVNVHYRTEILSYELLMAMVSDGVLKGPLPAKPEPPAPQKRPTAPQE